MKMNKKKLRIFSLKIQHAWKLHFNQSRKSNRRTHAENRDTANTKRGCFRFHFRFHFRFCFHFLAFVYGFHQIFSATKQKHLILVRNSFKWQRKPKQNHHKKKRNILERSIRSNRTLGFKRLTITIIT